MWTLVIIIGAITAFLYHNFVGKRRGLPPGPTPLPLIGTIHQIFVEGDSPQNRVKALANKYGPVMTLWVGTQPAVFVTNYKMLKEYFVGKTADVFTSRPHNWVVEYFTMGNKGIIAASGQLWKEQRRFSLTTLRNFGFGRNTMEAKIVLEVDILINRIAKMLEESKGASINLADPLQTCIGSIITNVIIGHRFDQDDPDFNRLRKNLEDNFKLITHPMTQMISQQPWLRFLPGFSANFAQMKANRDSFYQFVKEEVETHKENMDYNAEPDDYTAAYLKEMHDRQEKGEDMGNFSEEQLIFCLIDLWAAGMETTVTTLKWAFLYLVNRPHIQEKVHREISEYFGGSDRPVSMDDRPNLPYVAATLNEVQRLANIVPINLFHENTQDIEVGGFLIPKNTAIIPQVSSVHLDPEIYPEPNVFKPERFLESDGKTLKKADSLMPFSLGKRICAGESLARMELFMVFTAVLRKYKLSSPDGTKMRETPVLGITIAPHPYNIIATPA